MPNVVVCYKWVVDEADVRIKDDLSIDLSRAKYKISDYDKNAIQAAAEMADKLGGKLYGVTFGPDPIKKSLKDALSRGLDEVYWIPVHDNIAFDSITTSRALAAQIKALEDVALVVCSDGSSDEFARQTGPRIAALLDWPVATSVISLDAEDEKLLLTSALENETEILECPFPAVVAVSPEISEAPIPSLKQVMSAGKKPQHETNWDELSVEGSQALKMGDSKGFVQNRKNVVFEGDVTEAVNQLVAALRGEGVI